MVAKQRLLINGFHRNEHQVMLAQRAVTEKRDGSSLIHMTFFIVVNIASLSIF
jgi:hypothetical protein